MKKFTENNINLKNYANNEILKNKIYDLISETLYINIEDTYKNKMDIFGKEDLVDNLIKIIKNNIIDEKISIFKKYNNFIFEKKSAHNNIIDYTYLKKNASVDELKKVWEDIEDYDVHGIAIEPSNIGTIKAFLEDSKIKVISIIDLPKGNSKTNNKINDIMDSITEGADEIDLVFNYTKLKGLVVLSDEKYDNLYNELLEEVQSVSSICHKSGVIIKLIIEIEELNYDQIKIACEICENSSVDFIQTSTGFSKKSPNWQEKIDKIKFMRRILPQYINIKVAGGIRTTQQIDELLSIGVDRIGTSVLF